MKSLIFSIIFLSVIFSEINLNGDARIRPRLDMADYGNDKSSMDLYYLYRARLNIDANIGNGWFFKTKLGTNDVASMVKMGVDDTYNKDLDDDDDKTNMFVKGYSDGPGNPNSARPQVNFLHLYYGIKKDNFGLWGGAIPIEENVALDIHFYPDEIIDIPWTRLNNGSTTGFAGYVYKLNWFISVDENKEEIYKDTYENIDKKNMDSYTIGFDFSMGWNDIIDNIHMRAIATAADLYDPLPITGGMDIIFASLFEINSAISYHYSTQFINKDSRYDITHLRIKFDREIGPGRLTFWTDVASRLDKKPEVDMEYKTDYMYCWMDYDYNLFNGDFGSVSIKPTIRVLNKKQDDPIKMYLNDVFTVPASLAGLPGISIPFGKDKNNLPLGIQILGKHFDEQQVFNTALSLEKSYE